MRGSKNAKSFVFGQSYIDLREDMNSLIKRFYKINHVTLSIIGLWPYQDEKTKFIRSFLVQVMMLCIFIPQITKLVSLDLNLDMFLEIIPFTLVIIAIFTSYYCNLAKIREVRIIWDHIRYDWNEPMDSQEISILEQYTLTGKLYNTVLLVGSHAVQAFLILQLTAPVALDIILPLNESRTFKPPPVIDIYLYQRKYYFLNLILLFAASVYIGILATATYGSFMVHVQHACGMFRLVRYTLDKAFEKTNRGLYTVEENETIYNNIVRSIKFHKRAIEFTEVVNIFTERICLIQITILFFINGIIIFRLFRIKMFIEKSSEAIICLLHIMVNLAISFINNHISQNVIDHSMAVFDQAYETPWHMLCPKTQRLLLMLMMSSLKPYYISIGNMFVACYEFYATFLQTTLSYTMIIHSLQ